MSTTNKSDYLLLFRGNVWDRGLSPAQHQKVVSDLMAWFERLKAEGKCAGGHPLEDKGKVVSGAPGNIPRELLPVGGQRPDGHELFGCSWLRNVIQNDARVQRGNDKANPNPQEHDVCAIRRFRWRMGKRLQRMKSAR